MRQILLSILFAGAISVQSFAAENFIPGGHTYSPDNVPLPELNSTQDEINLGADLIETEIYTKQRELKVFDSQMRRFTDDQELSGGDYSIDY